MQLIKTRLKLSQLILGSLLVFFSALGLYAGLTTHPKNGSDWFVIGSSLFLLYLAVVYLLTDLKSETSYLKDNTLNIDVEGKSFFSRSIGNSAPGIYKNGKYLGNIYKGFIKVGDGLTLGKRQGGTIGYLKILKDGKVVVKLTLTPEAFMELKPDKIHEVFPEIKGNIEKFKDLFKVGDYTLQYSLFTRSYRYAKSYADNYHNDDWFSDPAYSSFEGNIYHHD